MEDIRLRKYSAVGEAVGERRKGKTREPGTHREGKGLWRRGNDGGGCRVKVNEGVQVNNVGSV